MLNQNFSGPTLPEYGILLKNEDFVKIKEHSIDVCSKPVVSQQVTIALKSSEDTFGQVYASPINRMNIISQAC